MSELQQQSIIEESLHAKQDQPQESTKTTGARRKATSAQLRLAKFISERDVAEFLDVVDAVETGRYDQVEAWKREAQRKGSRIIEWCFPKYTRKGLRESAEEASRSPQGTTREKSNASS